MRSREEEQTKLIADLRSDILRSTALDAAFASGLSSVDSLQAEGGARHGPGPNLEQRYLGWGNCLAKQIWGLGAIRNT